MNDSLLQTPGFQFGEGVFTTMRVYRGQVEYLDEHLKRLASHAEVVGLECSLPDQKEIYEYIAHQGVQEGVWRFKIILYRKNVAATSFCFLLEPYKAPTDEFSISFFKYTPSELTARIKSLSCLDRLLLKKQALKLGYNDCLLHNSDSILLETSSANIFWKLGNTLYTPSKALPILWGIMLEKVQKSALDLGLQFCEVKASDIPSDSQVYVCNSLMHVRPVVRIDEKHFSRDMQFESELLACILSNNVCGKRV